MIARLLNGQEVSVGKSGTLIYRGGKIYRKTPTGWGEADVDLGTFLRDVALTGVMPEQVPVIVESPFRADTEEGTITNERYLAKCLRDCLDRGETPYASHKLLATGGVLDDNDPQQRVQGMAAGFAWAGLACKAVVYTDRGISEGMKKGIENALLKGLPIEYRQIEDLPEVILQRELAKATGLSLDRVRAVVLDHAALVEVSVTPGSWHQASRPFMFLGGEISALEECAKALADRHFPRVLFHPISKALRDYSKGSRRSVTG